MVTLPGLAHKHAALALALMSKGVAMAMCQSPMQRKQVKDPKAMTRPL
jgi:hypothetical protein